MNGVSGMAASKVAEKDLRRELNEFHDRYPNLAEDELFVLWFLRAFVTEDETEAAKAICGGARDKGLDAVLVDQMAKTVFVVQGKYRQVLNGKLESRADLLSFAQLAPDLLGCNESFSRLTENMAADVISRADGARRRLTKNNYRLQLFYVTMGKCSVGLEEEAQRIVRSANGKASFEVFDGKRILLLLSDYFDGVAPPVPSLDLEIESGQGVKSSGILNRYDNKTDIESWVFSMTDQSVAGLFEQASIRLFARNVRGFLGKTEINRGMEDTLASEPEYFWYYNNGITVICDDAKHESYRGRDILRVTNPQVINGQQTTRTLARNRQKGPRASVLVRVIRVPRDGNGQSNHFDSLVSQIVSATNWQNAIRPSDLMSNDRRQIEIERQFRKLGYYYMRKRMTKGEARRASGGRHYFIVKKEEIAQAVAGCDLDPSIVREGKERLFEERWYGHIFPTGDPNYYLSRYWALRAVSYNARGYPERAYAKWLVLNFAWEHLAGLLRGHTRAEAFRSFGERKTALLRNLDLAINAVFAAALQFYRSKRGKGATALDVSTFFQRRNLHKELRRFWRSPANKSRGRFVKSMKRFARVLADEVKT